MGVKTPHRYNPAMQPIIGITVDNAQRSTDSGKYESAIAYSDAVAKAGGLPMLLPQQPRLAAHYARQCHGILLTGGDDPATEAFGQATDPRANVIAPVRQSFELALLDALAGQPHTPVLGICLGMQMMALHAGGRLNQYLPDTLATAESHQKNRTHPLTFTADDSLLPPADGQVVSYHRQAVADAGSMRVIAIAPDGTIEAIDRIGERFYVGVQWHPERGDDGPLSLVLIQRFVAAARAAMSTQ